MKPLICIIAIGLLALASETIAQTNGWLKTPTVSVMTGFIYEPLKPYTIQQWMNQLGNRFDADQWVKDFKEAGASHLVFYDKWIDGLVFHDTKTTGFKTQRDFVRELAAACQRGGLPLVFYFNAVSDGNPEFDEWATLDKQGKPIVFSPNWPTRYQTLHSPFRAKCLEQVRELMSNYGPIHGLWHDIFSERLNSSSPWIAQGYAKMFNEPFAKATGARLAEFNARTLASYLDEAAAIRRERGQEQCLFTANGSGSDFFAGGIWTERVGARLQYLFNEGHDFKANDHLARMAWVLSKPLEINLLLNSSWFTPLEDAPPPSHLTEKQAIAATAIAVCQGAGVNWALTPGHAGTFGEDLQRAKAAGTWFHKVKSLLIDAKPYADVGIVPRNNAAAIAMGDALEDEGFFSRWISATEPLAPFRLIVVPPLSYLDEAWAGRLRHYVKEGGTLIVFGGAAGLEDVLGARCKGQVPLPRSSFGASVQVDSAYDAQCAAIHLLDDQPTFWASAGAPMPHWAEITLPKSVAVQTVEIINREGPYLVTDLEVEIPNSITKQVRDNNQRKILVSFDPPVSTGRLRVKILRELYQGQDRPYADLEAIRVLDRAGHNWASAKHEPVPIVTSALLRDADEMPFNSWNAGTTSASVEAVEIETAQVLGHFDITNRLPAVLRHKFGRGQALLVTASEHNALWLGLCKLTLGKPTFTLTGEAARRCRLIATRVGGDYVLHIIDPQADSPQRVGISLLASRFDHLISAFEVQPDPVASVVLKGNKP